MVVDGGALGWADVVESKVGACVLDNDLRLERKYAAFLLNHNWTKHGGCNHQASLSRRSEPISWTEQTQALCCCYLGHVWNTTQLAEMENWGLEIVYSVMDTPRLRRTAADEVALRTLSQYAAALNVTRLGKSVCPVVSRSQRTLRSYQPEKVAPSFSLMALTTHELTPSTLKPFADRALQQLDMSLMSVNAAPIKKMYSRIGPPISRNDHRQPDEYSTTGPAAGPASFLPLKNYGLCDGLARFFLYITRYWGIFDGDNNFNTVPGVSICSRWIISRITLPLPITNNLDYRVVPAVRMPRKDSKVLEANDASPSLFTGVLAGKEPPKSLCIAQSALERAQEPLLTSSVLSYAGN
ncbi:11452_t:CDS:2, partial [Acaulospora colombiana]